MLTKFVSIVFLGAVTALAPVGALAQPRHIDVSSCSASQGYYTNSNGRQVHRPKCNESHDSRATALCRDGSESYSKHHSGTCSHHDGVAEWYR